VALNPAIQSLVDRIGGTRRAMILVVGLLTAGLVFGISRWATAPTWVPAFPSVPLEKTDKLTQKLTEVGIEYHLEKGGTEIQVKAEDVAKARVAIASGGELPSSGRPGLELFDQPSWGMTDFTQRINYRRALEGELERTIGKMRGIELAQVHIAMAEGNVFRAADKPLEASVVLKLQNGETPPNDVVQGIAHLVAASVDGLQSDHVTIVDDGGRMLTLDNEAGSLAGLTSQQLNVQREVESYLEKKAQSIVGQIVGPKNARVQVSAVVNFDRVERTTQAVDPDKQAVSTEQKAEVTPGAQGGSASSNTATSYETTHSTEQFSGAIGNVKKLTVAVLVNDRLVPGPKPSTLPRTGPELARIDTLVRNAVGIDSLRGDKLSVVNTTFDGTLPLSAPEAEPKADLLSRLGEMQRPLVTGLALLGVLIVAVFTLRALRPAKAPELAAVAGADGVPALAAGSLAGSLAGAVNGATGSVPQLDPATGMPLVESGEHGSILISGPTTEAVVLKEAANPVRDQALAVIEQRPDAAARVVRAWLKQD
jgi:flagellar M-ring protein FliF